jgi:rubrerythrin
MGIRFNADEVFAMAEQIERNGARFYRKAAGAAAAAAIRELFGELAVMEDGHVEVFMKMRAELSEREREAIAFDPDGEAALYLKEFVEGRIFDTRTEPADRLTGSEKPSEVLTIAIGLEKDSIAFYVGIREMVSAKAGKDRLDSILREEMSHVRMLNQQLASLPESA